MSIQEINGLKAKDYLEVALKICKDPLVNKFAGYIGDIDTQKSVLEAIIDNLIDFFEATD